MLLGFLQGVMKSKRRSKSHSCLTFLPSVFFLGTFRCNKEDGAATFRAWVFGNVAGGEGVKISGRRQFFDNMG